MGDIEVPASFWVPLWLLLLGWTVFVTVWLIVWGATEAVAVTSQWVPAFFLSIVCSSLVLEPAALFIYKALFPALTAECINVPQLDDLLVIVRRRPVVGADVIQG